MKRFHVNGRKQVIAPVIMVLLVFMMVACGGGGSENTPAGTALTGMASKGPIDAGTISAYKVVNGAKDALLGTATTDSNGNFSVNIGSYIGPAILEVTGGSYKDEATGVTTALGTTMSSITPDTSSLTTVSVTPLSNAVFQIAQAASGGLTSTNIETAASIMKSQLGFDPITTVPADATSATSAAATDAARIYASYQGVVSQYLKDNAGKTLAQAITDLAGAAQGAGLANNTAFQTAMSNFMTSANNKTGLTQATLQTMITNLVSAANVGGAPGGGACVGSCMANGTYTYNATTGALNLTTTATTFPGEATGAKPQKTVVAITATVMTIQEPAGLTTSWFRSSGTAGNIVGSWTMGNNTMTFNADGTFSVAVAFSGGGSGGVTTAYSARGTFTYNATTGALNLNTTATTFPGEAIGAKPQKTVTAITATTMTIQEPVGAPTYWSRSSGTAGNISGIWTMGSFTMTFTDGGTFSISVARGTGGGVSSTTFTVSGTAAKGAVFDKATITIIAGDGTKYGGGAADITGADGSYTITLPLTAKPPFVVLAVRDDNILASVVAEAKDTTTNITPVTNLIASRLSTSGDPTKLADEIKANPALVDATKLTAKAAEIVALIKPLMDAVGDTTDPLNGKFVADGTGADKVLDSLLISITPSSATTVNIEVSVKQKLAEGDNPSVTAFTNTTASVAAIPTVTKANLVPDGTSILITDDFLPRMTACYALPLADRVTSGGTTAADIVAPACKTLFAGDDPTSYKHNGGIVSSTQAFASMFASGGTGVKFDRGRYEFTRGNGDLVIAYRATDSSGNSTNNALVVKTDPTSGKLKAIGNQYKYNGSVTAWHQQRTFINQSAASYDSTGYVLNVNDSWTSGKTIFNKVVVTTPKGGVLTLKPKDGYSYLPLVKSTGTSGTNFLRIRSVYTNTANSGKNPADADTNLFFASTPATDDEIQLYPDQSTWKFDYYLAANATTIPDATQYYKTRARAMTIPELRHMEAQPVWANLTDADITRIKDNSVAVVNNPTPGRTRYWRTPTSGPVTLNWTWVAPEPGTLLWTSIRVWGWNFVPPAAKSTSFNDTASVLSTSRTGSIACSPSGTDYHCDSSGNYNTGGLSDVQLWANDPFGREFSSHYAIYTVTIP